jgi:serine/threonine protein kinase
VNRYFQDEKCLYLILEYQSGGELYKNILRGNRTVNESTCQAYIRDICSALFYMHKRHIYHRDIKPENILISGEGKLSLTDFGWAVHAPKPNHIRYTMCGTPEYVSPEVVAGTGHDASVDMWALGILIYELLFGR